MAEAFSKASQGIGKFFGVDPTKAPRQAAQRSTDAAAAAAQAATEEQAKIVDADKKSAAQAASVAQDEAKLQARRTAISDTLRKEGGTESRRRFLKGAK